MIEPRCLASINIPTVQIKSIRREQHRDFPADFILAVTQLAHGLRKVYFYGERGHEHTSSAGSLRLKITC